MTVADSRYSQAVGIIGTTVITDDSIVMTPSTGDTVTIAAATNGVLNITTVDAGGTAGNIQITADGTAELAGTTVTLDSSGSIALDATADVLIPNGTDLVIGHTASVSTAGVASAFQLNGTTQAQTYLSFNHFQAGAGGGTLTFMKSRDPAIADGTFAKVENNDRIGQIRGFADDGADLDTETHRMNMLVEDATPAAGKVRSAWAWYTMQENTTTLGEKLRLNNTGALLIGDTLNANMPIGLTINQGASDPPDQILTLKSSDIDTGLGNVLAPDVEPDDFVVFSKNSATLGGLKLMALAEDDALGTVLNLEVTGGTATDVKASGGRSLAEIVFAEHNGSNALASVAGDGNLFGIISYDGGSYSARFIVDEDGQIYATANGHTGDISVGALADSYDDAQLLRAFDHAKSADGASGLIRDKWDEFIQYNEQDLIDVGVLGATMAEGGLLSVTGLQRLHNGAIWQGYVRQQEMQTRIESLEQKLLAIGA